MARIGFVRCLSQLGGFYRVAYREYGHQDNLNVVFCVHGLTRNCRDFDFLAEQLADTHRVVCVDVVGRGNSDWVENKASYNYAQYMQDMTTVLASVGADQVHWVGTSMGGLIGMMLAAQPNNPIKSLVLNDIGPFLPKAALERIASYVGKECHFSSREEVKSYFKNIYGERFGPDMTEEHWEHLTQNSSFEEDGKFRLGYDPGISHVFSNPSALQDLDLWSLYDQISCPVLALRGEISDIFLAETAQQMTERGPRARIVEFANVGHHPQMFTREQNAETINFIQEHS